MVIYMSKYNKKLKNILKNIKKIFPETEDIDYLELSKKVEYTNVLFNKIKDLILQSKNDNELLIKIKNLKDEDNNTIFNDEEAQYVLELTPKFKEFLQKLEKNNRIYNEQKGGELDMVDSFNNFKSDLSLSRVKGIATNIFNWVFFPLWSVERIPYLGTFVGINLDFMELLLDNLNIYHEVS